MNRWFSTYWGEEPFNAVRKPQTHQYNEVFKKHLQKMRMNLHLKKLKVGIEVYDQTEPLEFMREGDSYFVFVERLEWLGIKRHPYYETPQFKIKLRIERERSGLGRLISAIGIPSREVMFSRLLIMEFEDEFPQKAPLFRIEGVDSLSGSHSHHMNSGGWLCIFSSGDWKPRTGTFVSAFLVAIKWIVWHIEAFGGLPD